MNAIMTPHKRPAPWQEGFTLVELLVSLAVVSALLAVMGLQFQGWRGKYNMESQIKTLYSDLMTARTEAKAKNRQYLFVMSRATPRIYVVLEDTDNDGQAFPDPDDLQMEKLSKDYTGRNGKRDFVYNSADDPLLLRLDKRGFAVLPLDVADPANLTGLTIGLDIAGADRDANVDCLNILPTRMKLGKYDGGNCVEK